MSKREPPTDPIESLRKILLDLKLTTIERELSGLLREAEEKKPSYSEFLRRAAEMERAARWERKIQRRLRRSRLGATMPLDQFKFEMRPQLSPQVVRELATGRFVRERRNLLIVGRPSTGKTSVAKALGEAVCRAGLWVHYATMSEMLADLHAAKADGTYRKALRRYARPDLLLIDDAGFANLDRDNCAELFRVVCERHRQRSTLVISNLPFRQWAELMPSQGQAVAIVDRLIDDATILRFSGEPFRKPRDIYGGPLEGEPS